MPPRIPCLSRLNASTLCLRPAVKPSPLPIQAVANASTMAQRRQHHDPYAMAQARQRKAANMKRQEELRQERETALGDPVRGVTTPFVESFDTVGNSSTLTLEALTDNPEAIEEIHMNHLVKSSELVKSLQHSYILTQPVITKNRDLQDPVREAEAIQKHAEGHERAVAAVARIISIANGNQKDRTRANIQRCITTFGRHETDKTLRPRAPSNQYRSPEKTPLAEKTPRAGPDTGSSEVQIAILTAKIRVLASQLEIKGAQKDKINKRNLRVLVHRRQKLLAYLRKKERVVRGGRM